MKEVLAMVLIVALVVGHLILNEPAEGNAPNTITLSEKNTVVINRPISGESVRDAQIELMDHSPKLPKSEPLYLFLNSPGGNISDGLALIETVKGLGREVSTVSMFSASMSFIISQYLGTRYVMESSELMSHRAVAGQLEGQIPGNLLSRTLNILAGITRIDQHVSERAGMTLTHYRDITRDELWMDGAAAVNNKFADKVINVNCDKSLRGPGKVEVMDLGFLQVAVLFDKCPLITTPLLVQLQGGTPEQRARVNGMVEGLFYHRREIVQNLNSLDIK